MDWGTFRALEIFAILLDVQVDEELFNAGPCRVFGDNGKPVPESLLFSWTPSNDAKAPPWKRRFFCAPPAGVLPSCRLKLSVDDAALATAVDGWIPSIRSDQFAQALDPDQGEISRLWVQLLLAKLTRALLMGRGETQAYEALDGLGLALIREMPLSPPTLADEVQAATLLGSLLGEDDDPAAQASVALQTALLRVLFMLEASACCRGYHSIAYAEDALLLLERLGASDTRGESPYELVASYDKAQGEFHARLHEKAYVGFVKAASDLELWRVKQGTTECEYFSAPNTGEEPWRTYLRWPGDELLFKAYIGFPCALQAAESLINLQRSWDASNVFDMVDGAHSWGTQYQNWRREVLRERIINDVGGVDSLPAWETTDPKRPTLELQRLAVDIERTKDPASRIAGLSDRAARVAFDATEFDQTVLEWVKGIEHVAGRGKTLSVEALDYLSAALPTAAVWDGVDSFRDAALDLAASSSWREHKTEIRLKLTEELPKLLGRSLAEGEDVSRLESLRRYVADVFARLISSSGIEFADVQLHQWRQSHRLSQAIDAELPLEEALLLQNCLRQFVHEQFVLASADDLPADCAECREHLCLSSSPENDCRMCVSSMESNPAWQPSRGVALGHLHYFDVVQKRNQREINGRLYNSDPSRTNSGVALAVLQRWNSYTPAMAASEGGGYFLYETGPTNCSESGDPKKTGMTGIVIDPGYGFLKNFLGQGYGIKDISGIAITHDHPDHLADFEALVNLVFALNDKFEEDLQVQAVLSSGAFEHLRATIDTSRKVFLDTAVLIPDESSLARKSLEFKSKSSRVVIRLEAKKALHRDSTYLSGVAQDSIGFLAVIRRDDTYAASVGFPSDTKWTPEIASQYADCDVVCLHLGSVTKDDCTIADFFDSKRVSSRVLRDGNHLHLPGVIWFINELRKHQEQGSKLVVLSEFGEEMSRGLRQYLAKRLDASPRAGHDGVGLVRVIPGDVGLLIDPVSHTMQCSCCEQFYPWDAAFEYEAHGDSEQIFYVCPECHATLSPNRRAAIFCRKQTPLMRMTRQ